jgi:hypothetical protein
MNTRVADMIIVAHKNVFKPHQVTSEHQFQRMYYAVMNLDCDDNSDIGFYQRTHVRMEHVLDLLKQNQV